MSNDSGMRLWVGDLDGYINIEAINRANEREAEEELLRAELDEVGDIALLAGRSISAHALNSRGVTPSEWRWAIHQAESTLRDPPDAKDIERNLVRALLSLGRPYAIARFAKWENIPHPSALAASLPYGLKALLAQFLVSEGLQRGRKQGELIRTVFKAATELASDIAYRRTGMIQSAIHKAACDAHGPNGSMGLNAEGIRTMLSLTRLHFAVAELNVGSFRELRELDERYEVARAYERTGVDEHPPLIGRHIPAWRLRHIRPLSYLFPFSIRHAIARGAEQMEWPADRQTRSIAVNELALAHCGIVLMRRSAKGRRVSG